MVLNCLASEESVVYYLIWYEVIMGFHSSFGGFYRKYKKAGVELAKSFLILLYPLRVGCCDNIA